MSLSDWPLQTMPTGLLVSRRMRSKEPGGSPPALVIAGRCRVEFGSRWPAPLISATQALLVGPEWRKSVSASRGNR